MTGEVALPSADLDAVPADVAHVADDELDFSDIEARYAPKPEVGFAKTVVIDNLPAVDAAKEPKLVAVIKKILKSIADVRDECIFSPRDDASGLSLGFMFVEFDTAAQAELAVKQANGYRLDKQHVLSVHHFDDIEKYCNMDDAYTEPEEQPFAPRGYLRSWQLDPNARDQMVMLRGEDVAVYWCNRADKPQLEHSRAHWTDAFVLWSPQGSFLATFHKQGIALWGGPEFEKISRFPHPNVRLIDFSPGEKYLTTWSAEPFKVDTGEKHNIVIWDIFSGRKLRSFFVDPREYQGEAADSIGPRSQSVTMEWPLFKWSHDDRYFARCVKGEDKAMISVYEAPGMGLLDKKSIKIEHVQDFEWSPSDNILAYWCPEVRDIPARVSLLEIPTKKTVRSKNLFNVERCWFDWHPDGTYLAVRVDRLTKSKKSSFTNIELFRCADKDYPMETLELKTTEELIATAWEPKGDKLAMITKDGPRTYVAVYEMEATVGDIQAVKVVDRVERKVNTLLWSPRGRFFVAAAKGQGDLEFWDSNSSTPAAGAASDSRLQLMNTGEHYMCTDIEWDPTGRYVTSSVSWWRIQTDTGIMLWSFTGVQMIKQTIPQFKQILWRPRPKTSLLTPELEKKVRKNIKAYSKEFEKADAATASKANLEVIEKRAKQWTDWQAYRKKCAAEYAKHRDERRRVRGYDEEEEAAAAEDLEEWEEEIVDEVEEVIE